MKKLISGLDISEAIIELNKLEEKEKSFDSRWENTFGSDEGTDAMSVDDFFKELEKMKKFK